MNADTDSLAKIANILAVLATKDLNLGDTVRTMSVCGFSNREISALTGSSEGSVRAQISQGRKSRSGD